VKVVARPQNRARILAPDDRRGVDVRNGKYERLRRVERLKGPTFVNHLLTMPSDDETFERLDGGLRDPHF